MGKFGQDRQDERGQSSHVRVPMAGKTVGEQPSIVQHLVGQRIVVLPRFAHPVLSDAQRRETVRDSAARGVALRFIRTLREQAIHGRIFKTVEDVRQAVREFVTTYNREWRVEKCGFMTPNEARSNYLTRIAA